MPPRRRRAPAGASPPDVLARLSATALDAQALLLGLDPILGEHTTQRAVDDFVEYAADALRALAEIARSGLPEGLDAGGAPGPADSAGLAGPAVPRGERWSSW